MKIETDISDDKLQNLSPTAKTELEKIYKQYLEEVLDEASKIEESRRTSNSNPEITATIINEAVAYAKNYGIRKRKPKRLIWSQIIAFISTSIAWGIFDVEKFKDPLYVIGFILIFGISVGSTVYLIFNDSNND